MSAAAAVLNHADCAPLAVPIQSHSPSRSNSSQWAKFAWLDVFGFLENGLYIKEGCCGILPDPGLELVFRIQDFDIATIVGII